MSGRVGGRPGGRSVGVDLELPEREAVGGGPGEALHPDVAGRVAAKSTLSVPPSPVVVDQTGCQVVPSVETSIRYDRAYAASQRSTTRLTGRTEPRSTVIHWLSDQELAQRVPGLPSTARAAPLPDWLLDAVTVRPAARLVMSSPRPAGNDTTCW